jgi:hypothetical protein
MEYIAFDAHKRYTLASVARSDGRLVREQRIPHARGARQQFLERCERGSPVAVETKASGPKTLPDRRWRGEFRRNKQTEFSTGTTRERTQPLTQVEQLHTIGGDRPPVAVGGDPRERPSGRRCLSRVGRRQWQTAFSTPTQDSRQTRSRSRPRWKKSRDRRRAHSRVGDRSPPDSRARPCTGRRAARGDQQGVRIPWCSGIGGSG